MDRRNSVGSPTDWRLAAAKALHTNAEIAAISRAVGGRLQRHVGRMLAILSERRTEILSTSLIECIKPECE